MTPLEAATTAPAGPASGGTARDSTAVSGGDLANQEVFLRLLVAQMQNQNPLSPADPIQFLSQLAQFSSLEQTIKMRQRLDSIHEALLAPVAEPPVKAPGKP